VLRLSFQKMRIEVEILNELGLHARPAAEFVRAVQKFKCEITICKDGEMYSAASILDVLSANLDCGARIALEAIGPDAEPALAKLQKLLHDFREHEIRERNKG
jgi:phosphocarrier protein HPr